VINGNRVSDEKTRRREPAFQSSWLCLLHLFLVSWRIARFTCRLLAFYRRMTRHQMAASHCTPCSGILRCAAVLAAVRCGVCARQHNAPSLTACWRAGGIKRGHSRIPLLWQLRRDHGDASFLLSPYKTFSAPLGVARQSRIVFRW
jgi:hypothetical protein